MEIAIIPSFLIKRLSSDYQRQNDYNIILSNISIFLLFISSSSFLIPILNKIPHFCLIDNITGHECPVCGITRAFCELSNGNLSNAYRLNRTSILIAFYFIAQIPLRFLSIKAIVPNITINKISKFSSRTILFIILINWIINLLINQ
jgi:hypothetical protein